MARPKTTIVDHEARVGDLHDLRAFALASDLRSLGAVAKVTGESKATVSRRITRLEAALGVSLLVRSSRGVAPTEDGAAYRQRVGEVLELLGDANAAVVHGGQATPSGQLRVSTPPGFSDVLAPLFARFCEQYPEIILVVHVSTRFVDLEREHFDVTLRATTKLADSSLVVVPVGETEGEGVLVATADYLARRPLPRRPLDLAAHRIIALGETGAPTAMTLSRRSGGGDPLDLRLPVAIVGSDIGFCKQMVLQGAGITCLPRLSVETELADGRLVHVLPGWVWSSMNLFLLHRGGPFVRPKVRAFLDFMRNALKHSKR